MSTQTRAPCSWAVSVGMTDGDGVEVARIQGFRHGGRRVVLAPLHDHPVDVEPAQLGDPGEPLAEGAVHQAQDPAAGRVADRHLHHAGAGGGGDVDGTAGAEDGPEPRLESLHQRLHLRGPVAHHGADHGPEDLGPDLGGTREEEPAELGLWDQRHRHSTMPSSIIRFPLS